MSGQARKDAALIADVQRAIGAIVNCTEQSDQIDGLERLAYRSLNKLSVSVAALEAALQKADEFLRRLNEWDMLFLVDGKPPPGAGQVADAAYWKTEIARVRSVLAGEGGE